MAWEGFNTMGYNVTCFEERDIDKLDITPETPVFAGVTVFRKVIDKLGIEYPPFNCYPDVLKPYYGRAIRRSILGEERRKFSENPIPVFVKPVLPKQFTGDVWTSILQLIPIAKVPDDVEVWVCEPMKIKSEFRVYVHDREVVGVKHYYGHWAYTPNPYYVDLFVKEYKGAPVAYGIDIAVVDKTEEDLNSPEQTNGLVKDVVLEVNDGCNLGNYGIDSIHYGEMIVSRWFEIMALGKNSNSIRHNSMQSYANSIVQNV